MVCAESRSTALAKLDRALATFDIAGVTTNIAFLRALTRHPATARNEVDTGFIERELARLLQDGGAPGTLELTAAAIAILARQRMDGPSSRDPHSPWNLGTGWSMVGERHRPFRFRDPSGMEHMIVLRFTRAGLMVEHGEVRCAFTYRIRADGAVDIYLDGVKALTSATWLGREWAIATPRGRFGLIYLDPFASTDEVTAAGGRLTAPMPGTVSRVFAEAGQVLERGDPVLAIEAMKMEHILRAPAKGRLVAFRCAKGDFVQDGTDLIAFEPVEDEP